MSDDIKKLLSIMKESTTAGAIAPTAGAMGNSMLKRPADSIFAAENIDPGADTGLEESPKVDSPANFALWKNSALIGEEQYGNHGRKKMKMDKTKMYPQKLGESFQKDYKDEEDTFTSNEKISKGNEQNAGLDEPDEFKPDFGGDKSGDFGTWHFKFDSGNVVKKDGKPVLASSMKDAKDIQDRASKRGVTIEIVDGAPEDEDKQLNELSPKTLASYKKKAGQSASEADKRGDFAKGHKRFKGINRATQRELDNGAKGVAEGLDQPREAGQALQSLQNLALMKSSLTMQQLTQAGRESIVINAINAAKTLERSYLADKQQGAAIFVRSLRDEIDNFRRGLPINSSMSDDSTSELGELLQGKLGKVNFNKSMSEGSWDGTGEQDVAAAIASDGIDSQDAQTEKQISLSEAEITEEMIADRLKDELALFKKGTKAKDKAISKKPVNRGVQPKKVEEVSDDTLKSYQDKVSTDSQKHPADPTKRKPEKASRSVAGFAKAHERLRKEKQR